MDIYSKPAEIKFTLFFLYIQYFNDTQRAVLVDLEVAIFLPICSHWGKRMKLVVVHIYDTADLFP